MLSFVVPAFNEERLIGQCLASIDVEANGAYEIIVVDNGSTDHTAQYANLFGVKVITEKRKGVVRARQAGLAVAKGDLIAFIDADCRLPKGWHTIVQKIMDDDSVVLCSGPYLFDELGLFRRLVMWVFYCLGLLTSKIMPMCQGGNFVVRKDALDACGGFNTGTDFYGEDTETAMRMSKHGRVVFSLEMYVRSSARRIIEEGFIRIGLRYIANYFWMSWTGRPWSLTYIDVRPDR